MKFLVLVLSLVFTLNAQAGLITKVTTTADQVILDFSVEDFLPETGQITSEYLFEESQLQYVSYTDDDYLNNDLFGSAWGSAGVFTTGLLSLDFIFLTAPFDSSFNLGQVVFNILDNTSTPVITEHFVEAADYSYNIIDIETTFITAVPEPTTIALFSLMSGLMFMRRRQK